ncbi:hypothetical protein BJ878DRAFT_575379 [Calycina marina]|uniref:Uncharacterized protein n=1 Tax=Calycina marina TaxID=1763456 RepID=A0A9P8CFL0_9HELO|nr:hypothetical protein BJ878DRAFT_575379 [Calycina marina]
MILPRVAEDAYNTILPRYISSYRTCSYNSRYCSNWSRYGRWVLAGVLIFVALVLVFFLLCCRQRRRRRRMNTATPMATQPAYANNNGPGYGNQGYNSQYAPPAGPPPQEYGGANNSYYGQQTGVSQPAPAYQQGYK